jgi:hypothetical protein
MYELKTKETEEVTGGIISDPIDPMTDEPKLRNPWDPILFET